MEQLLERVAALEAGQRSSHRSLAVWRAVACAAALIGLLLLPLRASTAQGGGSQSGGLPALAQRVTVLETTVASQGGQIAALQNTTGDQSSQIAVLQAALRQEIANRQAADTALQTSLNTESAARTAANNGLQNQITPLTSLFLAPNGVNGQPFFSRQGGDITVTGANLHIVNGLGATNGFPADPSSTDTALTAVNGLGNLIVGYNDSRSVFEGPPPDSRTGSHNLVVGVGQNFSSFGSLVAGYVNSVSGPFVAVSGGVLNVASGLSASVSGGAFNVASGESASVSGGVRNIASGLRASVSGGLDNIASATGASVSGGGVNTASGSGASVSGGFEVNASAAYSWAAGGNFHPAGGPGTFHSP